MSYLKTVLKKVPLLIFISLLILAIFLINKPKNIINRNTQKLEISKNILTDFFEKAESYKIIDSVFAIVLDKNAKEIGRVIYSHNVARDVTGFAGSTPIFIFVDTNSTIKGIHMPENGESESYVELLRKEDFFNRWNHKNIEHIKTVESDAISGCTYTVNAVVQNLNLSINTYNKAATTVYKPATHINYLELCLSVVVVILALICFVKPNKTLKTFTLALSLIVLGFMYTNLLSIERLVIFAKFGISPTNAIVFVILCVSLLVAIFTNKSLYCGFLCPYGAAQELLGKISKKKITIPKHISEHLVNIKYSALLICVFLILTNLVSDFSNIEPFGGFNFSGCSGIVLILFGVFLLISIFVKRAWCKYFCPTGAFLEIFRKKHDF